MVVTQIVVVAIHSLNSLNLYAAILLLKGEAGYLSVLATDQLNALVLFFLKMFNTGFDLNGLYFSFWLLPLGYLLYISGLGRFSRILGCWLMISFLAFLINFLTRFLCPGFHRSTIFWVSGVLDISEIVLCFWLLLKGIQVKKEIQNE